MSNFCISYDPNDLASRFSTEDALSFSDYFSVTTTEIDEEKLQKVRDILDSLPQMEADFIDLYYFKKMKQTDIAKIFRVSQPTVCYRLKRAVERIQYLFNLPTVDLAEMEEFLQAVLDDELDVTIMLQMYETTCQSEVATWNGLSQGLVRHRFIRTLRRLKTLAEEDEESDFYHKLFRLVSDNLNILREISRSKQTASVEKTYIIE
jgi:DNA-directed RNA polymerase specialized sigma24 family protein